MASIIEQIKSDIDIVEYIEQYVDLTVKGQNHVGLCPFHSDNDPSFKVSPAKNIFKCFGCGKGGNIFNFVTLYHKVDFGEAIRILSGYLGVEEPDDYKDYYNQMATWHKHFTLGHNTFSQQYFVDRNIEYMTYSNFRVGFIPNAGVTMDLIVTSEEIMMKLGVIYKPKTGGFRFKFPGCLTFPFFDDRDRVVGFSFMRIDRRPDEPKYENSWTTPIFKRRELLFGLKQSRDKIKEERKVLIVEGYFDLMKVYQVRTPAVVAVCGSIMTDEQVSIIKRLNQTTKIIFDGDDAGTEGAIKSAFKCEEAGVTTYIGDLPGGSDPDSFYKGDSDISPSLSVPEFFMKYNKHGDAGVDILMSHASKIKGLDVLEDYMKVIKKEYPNIPTSLIASRMSRNITATSEKYKSKPSEFSIQRELIKAMLQGVISPTSLDSDKFNNDYRGKVEMLVLHYKEYGHINLDGSIMSQFTEFLEPLNVTVEELPKLALPYRKFKGVDEIIKAKKELHD